MLPQHRAAVPSAGEVLPSEIEENNQNVANEAGDGNLDDLIDGDLENLDGIPEGIEEMFENLEAEVVEDDDSDEEKIGHFTGTIVASIKWDATAGLQEAERR